MFITRYIVPKLPFPSSVWARTPKIATGLLWILHILIWIDYVPWSNNSNTFLFLVLHVFKLTCFSLILKEYQVSIIRRSDLFFELPSSCPCLLMSVFCITKLHNMLKYKYSKLQFSKIFNKRGDLEYTPYHVYFHFPLVSYQAAIMAHVMLVSIFYTLLIFILFLFLIILTRYNYEDLNTEHNINHQSQQLWASKL